MSTYCACRSDSPEWCTCALSPSTNHTPYHDSQSAGHASQPPVPHGHHEQAHFSNSFSTYSPTGGSYYYHYGPGFHPSQPQHPYPSRYSSSHHLMHNMPFHHTTLAYLPGEVPPQIQRPTLGNATTAVVNVPPQASATVKATRKCKQGPTLTSSMQKHCNIGSIATPAVSAPLSLETVPPDSAESRFP